MGQKRGTEGADEMAGHGSESIGAPCPVCVPVLRSTDDGCRPALARQGRRQGCLAAPPKAALLRCGSSPAQGPVRVKKPCLGKGPRCARITDAVMARLGLIGEEGCA